MDLNEIHKKAKEWSFDNKIMVASLVLQCELDYAEDNVKINMIGMRGVMFSGNVSEFEEFIGKGG